MDSIGSYKKKIAQALSEKINLTLREAELEAQFIMQYVLKESSSNLIIKKNEIVLKKDITIIGVLNKIEIWNSKLLNEVDKSEKVNDQSYDQLSERVNI